MRRMERTVPKKKKKDVLGVAHHKTLEQGSTDQKPNLIA